MPSKGASIGEVYFRIRGVLAWCRFFDIYHMDCFYLLDMKWKLDWKVFILSCFSPSILLYFSRLNFFLFIVYVFLYVKGSKTIFSISYTGILLSLPALSVISISLIPCLLLFSFFALSMLFPSFINLFTAISIAKNHIFSHCCDSSVFPSHVSSCLLTFFNACFLSPQGALTAAANAQLIQRPSKYYGISIKLIKDQ